MIRKGTLVIVLIAMCGVIGNSTLIAQSMMYPFTLGAYVGFEGTVELKWSRLPGDSVRYYLVYRALMSNTLAFTRIDSTTLNSKVDMPPTSSIPPVYLYVVEAKMKGGSMLRSNIVTVTLSVVPKIDAVRITSEPVRTGRVGTPYTYQVDDDPVENPDKRDEACDKAKGQCMEQILPLDGIKEGYHCKPEKTEVEIWKGKNKENSRNSTKKNIPFFHRPHLKKFMGVFQCNGRRAAWNKYAVP